MNMNRFGQFRVVALKSDFAQEFIYAPEYSMIESEATHVAVALMMALPQQIILLQYRDDEESAWRNW